MSVYGGRTKILANTGIGMLVKKKKKNGKTGYFGG